LSFSKCATNEIRNLISADGTINLWGMSDPPFFVKKLSE
jgi:hypothetical protein